MNPFHVLVVIADPAKEKIKPALVLDIKKRLAAGVNGAIEERWLSEGEAIEFRFAMKDPKIVRINCKMLLDEKPFDWAILPVEGRRKKLLVSDMDSTLIEQECIDELADFAGMKAEVAKITERAMNGELDFKEALEYRVSLLKDLPTATLDKAYKERITLMPGARELVQTMKASGAKTLLVSGGFTYFTGRVREKLGFDEDSANQLDVAGDKLTGKVIPPILDKESKLHSLQQKAESLWLQPSETLAIGDGANDLPMIKAAGLGVAYRAKPLVRKEAAVSITHGNLTAVLFLQGYTKKEFVA